MKLEPPDCPALWTPAQRVTREDREIHQLTLKLMEEARARVSAAGLAAPQVGLSLRMFVTMYAGFPICLNPEWKPVGQEFISKPERCLSNLAYSTYMRRPAKCYAIWENEDGFRHSALLEGMEARVFQHLSDLCDGKPMFPRPCISTISS